ncbi:MAG: sigma 54-interacting transcriptional regulator [Sedimentisphaerales bacterium]|nr:sigma 54-interacting transcriptional regulator [Sedimentisphaerales bacterium]
MIKLVFIDIKCGWRAVVAASLAEKQASSLIVAGKVVVRAVVPEGYEVKQDIKSLSFLGIDPSGLDIRPCNQCCCDDVDVVVNLDAGYQGACKSLPGKEIVIDWKLLSQENESDLYFEAVERELSQNIRNLFKSGYLSSMAGLKHEMEAILDHLPSGVIVHDLARKINWFNSAAEQILGYSREDVIGRDCHEVFANGFCGGQCEFCDKEAHKPNVMTISPRNYVINTITKGGVPRKIEMFVSPVKDLQDRAIGVIACFNDITEVTQLRNDLKKTFSFHGIIGADKSMQEIYSLIRDLADSDCSVLIQGESGTGKELVAGAIHGESQRSGKPFVAVNCGALPEGILESELFGHVKGSFTGAYRDKKGKFELADGGTIFLDEVGELSQPMQVKLLRVLQEQVIEKVGGEESIRINVRVISATNRDLRKMIKAGQFREDLFYRLCVVPINLPSLRQRRNDIPLLLRHFVKQQNNQQNRNLMGLTDQALQMLIDYPWPGNIREMQNAIQYAFVKCKADTIGVAHLPPEILQTASELKGSGGSDRPLAVRTEPARRRKRKLDRQAVVNALKSTGGNRSKAAEALGVGRATLYRFMQDAGLI